MRVEAVNPSHLKAFSRIFGGSTVPAVSIPEFRLTVREGTPEAVPVGAATIYRGPVFGEGACHFAKADGRHYLQVAGRVALVLERDGRQAFMTVASGHEERAGMAAGIFALQAAINATGQFLLHAAGVTMPGSDDLAVIFGHSGAGKTTTTLSLCDAGFGLCSDDTMIFRATAQGTTAWGLPRNLKVHRNTAAMLDWVAPLLSGEWNDENERPLRQVDLKGRIRFTPSGRQRVAGLFKLERSGGTQSSVSEMGAADALAALAADNMRLGAPGLMAGEAKQFSALAGLVRCVPVFRLRAGTDLATIAPALMAALANRPATS